jgi:hypothetical protein
MTSFFELSMRHGARILLAVALLDVIVGVGARFAGIEALTQPYDSAQSRAVLALVSLAGSLQNAALPFFGALVIDRLDRWREARA